jgi:gliding motility-associated-like protein
MLKQLLIFFCFSLSHVFHAQVTVYQDVLKGGITAAGGNIVSDSGTVFFDVYLEPGSTIKKAFFIAGAEGKPSPTLVNLNGINYLFSDFTIATQDFTSISPTLSNVHLIDVTNNINPSINNYTLFIPKQDFLSQNFFIQFYLIIIYSNPILTESACTIALNNINSTDSISFNYNSLFPINTSNKVGFSIVGQHFCNNIFDGSFVKINNSSIGLLGGSDPNNLVDYCDGVRGHFYYQNNNLYGLSNDTPDQFMNGGDALANIQQYFPNNIMNFTVDFIYQNPTNIIDSKSNPIVCTTLAYTTPCQPQNVSVSSDTTICPNEPLQLFATGGVSYEWLPAAGLSCSTCANPVFVGDSSQLYTVRIWGNDSCSVVRPVMVHVRQQPTIAALVPTTTTCGLNQGTVQLTLADTAAVQFAIDNGPLQDTAYFPNLSAGSHTLSLHDAVGCSFDTLVTIAADTTVSALFTATPSTGAAPLQVALSNQSTNATDYVWQLDGVTQANPFSSFTATTSGMVQVQLIAYQNNPSCADTAWTSIFVYDSVIVSIPNVFSPNNDNTNEFFGITSNTPLTISGALVNRWGQTMVAWEDQVTLAGFTQLWNGTNAGTPASDGVYFYHITWSKAGKTGELSGNVNLVR